MMFTDRRLWLAASLSMLSPLAMADGVSVRATSSDPAASVFPSNRYTVFDGTQKTLRRVQLPKPDCAVRVSDCQDIDVINTLDGFSTQPRITVPFTGDIDPASVNSQTVYLVNLGDTLTTAGPASAWASTRYFGILRRRRWCSKATSCCRSIRATCWSSPTACATPAARSSRAAVGAKTSAWPKDATAKAPSTGVSCATRCRANAAGPTRSWPPALFSTQSATSDLAKINRSIKQTPPTPVDFMIGPGRWPGGARGVSAPHRCRPCSSAGRSARRPASAPAPYRWLRLASCPARWGRSPTAATAHPTMQPAGQYIPATGTLTGMPQQQGSNDLVFQLFVPAGARPAGGWPVAIFGHGFTDSMSGAPWTVAAVLASQASRRCRSTSSAMAAAPLGTLTVLRRAPTPVTCCRRAGAASTRTATARSTPPKASTPPRRAPSSAAATACARP